MSTDPTSPERRVAVRAASTQEASCHFATLEKIECRWAKVHDISTGGICLSLDCAFDAGQQVIIELPSKTLEGAVGVSARVIRCVPQAAGTWMIGCAFQRALSAEEFQALL